jgi:hypothetical protein
MTYREDFIPAIACTFIATFSFCFFVGLCILKSERRCLHNEAIKRDYAEWINDGEGNPVFTWKEPTQ